MNELVLPIRLATDYVVMGDFKLRDIRTIEEAHDCIAVLTVQVNALHDYIAIKRARNSEDHFLDHALRSLKEKEMALVFARNIRRKIDTRTKKEKLDDKQQDDDRHNRAVVRLLKKERPDVFEEICSMRRQEVEATLIK